MEIGDNMKRILKSRIFVFVLGLIVMAGISYGVYAINASEITYKESNVEDAIEDLYGKVDQQLVIKSITFSSAGFSEAYGLIYLPDLTNYKTLSIDSITLNSGSFRYTVLYDASGAVVGSFTLSNSVQSIDIENYNGTGYCIGAYARNMGTYKDLTLNNIRLEKE